MRSAFHLRIKRFEEAFAAFDAAVTVRPDYTTGLIMRARMHRQFGRTDAAVRDLKTAVSLDRREIDGLQGIERVDERAAPRRLLERAGTAERTNTGAR